MAWQGSLAVINYAKIAILYESIKRYIKTNNTQDLFGGIEFVSYFLNRHRLFYNDFKAKSGSEIRERRQCTAQNAKQDKKYFFLSMPSIRRSDKAYNDTRQR